MKIRHNKSNSKIKKGQLTFYLLTPELLATVCRCPKFPSLKQQSTKQNDGLIMNWNVQNISLFEVVWSSHKTMLLIFWLCVTNCKLSTVDWPSNFLYYKNITSNHTVFTSQITAANNIKYKYTNTCTTHSAMILCFGAEYTLHSSDTQKAQSYFDEQTQNDFLQKWSCQIVCIFPCNRSCCSKQHLYNTVQRIIILEVFTFDKDNVTNTVLEQTKKWSKIWNWKQNQYTTLRIV